MQDGRTKKRMQQERLVKATRLTRLSDRTKEVIRGIPENLEGTLKANLQKQEQYLRMWQDAMPEDPEAMDREILEREAKARESE